MTGQPYTAVADRDRRLIVRLVILSFWLLIFEGSLRKWVAPQYSQYLYFIRDPLTLYIYFVAARAGVFRGQSAFLHFGMIFALLASLLAIVHVGLGGGQYTPILAAYGVRNYFFYIPLAFVIGRSFGPDDIIALARHCLFAMLIAAPLAVLQFNAAADSPLNVGRATQASLQFDNLVSGGGKVRPAGTFTSAVGMTQLIVCCVVFLIWAWTVPGKQRLLGPWLVRAASVATAAALAVSGSRTSFIHSCLVIAAGVAIAPLLRGTATKLRSILIPAVIIVAFVALFPIVLPEAFETFSSRWNDAAAVEGERFNLGLLGRALHGLYDFVRLMGQMPVFGYGVGMAGNGASVTGVMFEGVSINRVAEEDWSRHVVELGPVLALVFIAYRLSFGVSLGLQSLRAALRAADSLPVLLYVFAAVSLIQGQITGHGLVNGFGWLFVGACLAVTRIAAAPAMEKARDQEQPDDVEPVAFPNLMR